MQRQWRRRKAPQNRNWRQGGFAGPAWAWYLGLALVLAAGLLLPMHLRRHQLHRAQLVSIAPHTIGHWLPARTSAAILAAPPARRLRGAGQARVRIRPPTAI